MAEVALEGPAIVYLLAEGEFQKDGIHDHRAFVVRGLCFVGFGLTGTVHLQGTALVIYNWHNKRTRKI